MTADPITTTPDTSIQDAWKRMTEHRIRHLPVVDQGKLVGIVTDRDLRLVLPSPATTLEAHELTYLLDKLPVSEAMTADPITTGPSVPIPDAVRFLMRARIGAFPVVEDGRLVGILTRQDALKAFLAQVEADASRWVA
jgi:acetoin utilization protein AcuB